MKSSSTLTAAKTVICCLRWAAVLALVCYALGTLVYSALGPEAWAHRPAPFAVVQELVFMLQFYTLRVMAFVVAGAMIAPRARVTTAIVLAVLLVPLSLRNHVLSMGGPWLSWRTNYTHFSLETIGAWLGVVYIFWSEKTRASVTSVPPDVPHPNEQLT